VQLPPPELELLDEELDEELLLELEELEELLLDEDELLPFIDTLKFCTLLAPQLLV
jgi:hypothetical protein